jgi:hypothetical protein
MSAIGRTPARRYRRRWRNKNGLMVPTAEAVAEALATVPDDVPWTWAALRVLPVIQGDRLQVIDDVELEKMGFRPTSAFPRVEMEPGIDVSIAIDVDVVTMAVDREMLDRWDMTIERVASVALANLRREVGTWSGTIYTDSSYEALPIRGLEGWPAWATSLLLLPDELKRLFGDHDQLFIAPYQCCLLSLPVDVERDVAADIVDLYGLLNPRSLLIGVPGFVLRDGGPLQVEALPGFPDDPDFETESPA